MSTGEKKHVVTRIAPSPTGAFHLGTARTALYNYLFAKKHNGTFIVRFEDTDAARSDRRYEKDILDSLAWLGIVPDMVVRQSSRIALYTNYLERLLASGDAFVSTEPSKRDPTKNVSVIRYRNREPVVSFHDTVRGEVTIDLSDLGDFVIARGMTDPLYNLAAVVDDSEMGVTHVLRGDDHIVNTPRQVALFRALGVTPPSYTHIPLIHGEQGGKLSKRKGAASVLDFKRQGYMSDAVCNTVFLLGWSPKNDEKELFSRTEQVQAFTLDGIQKKEAVFSEKKLLWFNRQYVQAMPESFIRREIIPSLLRRFPVRTVLYPRVTAVIAAAVRERGVLFGEVKADIAAGEYDFYFVQPTYEADLLIPKGCEKKEVRKQLAETGRLLSRLRTYRGWSAKETHKVLEEHAEKQGKSLVFWPLRVALSGREKSPSPFDIMEGIGKRQSIARIHRAITLLRDTA